jgi:aminocarboxymuconate-semialdehyde decarboxylase
MIVDIHAHGLPNETLEALREGARRFKGVELADTEGGPRLSFAGGSPTRPIMSRLREAAPREEFLDAQSIDVQLVGGWLDSFGYELESEEGADWSRFQNESLASVCGASQKLVALATVPMQSGKLAAKVLREAVESGLPGAMIGTQPHGGHGNLDDPDLDEFWATAAELGAPIIVHPMFGSGDARLDDYQMMNAVGRITDLTIAVSRMLCSGHLTRFDGLALVASTGGGALPFSVGRLARNHAAFPKLVVDPMPEFERLYFDSIVFQSDALNYLVDKVGAEKVMLGSDYPFPIGDPTPRRVIEMGGFGAHETSLMLGGVAERLFNLERS